MGSLDRAVAPRRILFIDAFDSFTNNIVGLLEQTLEGAEVVVVHIDDADVARRFSSVVDEFDAVVVGPGPGHPGNPDDVGLIDQLWRLDADHQLPVLGICLGFQSLCLSLGATVTQLARARHGIVNGVTHSDADIFAGVGSLQATQYHSLRVEIASSSAPVWCPTDACPSIVPLAWDLDDVVNGPILMGARHATKPLWGVQFHPESICTSDEGKILLQNWWSHSRVWLDQVGRRRAPEGTWSTKTQVPASVAKKTIAPNLVNPEASPVLLWNRYPVEVSAPRIASALGLSRDQDVIVLDSQGHASGRYSILGLVVPGRTIKVTYRVSSRTLQYGVEGEKAASIQLDSVDDIWSMLQQALDDHDPKRQLVDGQSLPDDSPFWGGFMGYLSYEAGLETIGVEPHPTSDVADVNMAFIHRSIVMDHETGHVYVQSLLPGDQSWIDETGRLVEALKQTSEPNGTHITLDESLAKLQTTRPAEDAYRSKVLRCQEYLSSGDSYELCLTDETTMRAARGSIDEWALYQRLRQNNPAPFGAFMRLSGTTVVGSSPEKFLSWTRGGHCQFRPIKGTVRKGGTMTRDMAEAILSSSKERAENLMIVDLIRHDLSGVVGAQNTSVSKLMVVEEYETVYQLVSVIEGRFDGPAARQQQKTTGLDVLKASLPPGSMTGAPKKRSCEILRDIERRSRGIYSGVLGYMDVGGAGQFSVVIRTAVRGETDTEGQETWRIGAGGAVTIQSTDHGEFLEMETKQSSVLTSLFRSSA